jgi:ABC-2 type transport system ATP-binding protein
MTTTITGAAAKLVGLRKTYGEVRAVDGVDLLIAPGEVVALLGPNGAGKSTTVDMLLGLATPDAGSVHVFGYTPREAVSNGSVSAMLQGGALLEDATVGEVVGMIAALHAEPMPVRQALDMAGIEDLEKRRCTKLSGGQKQRVRFAMALVCDPDLLVLDEPTAAMDVAARREFWQSMREFTRSGKAVLFATHYLDEAEEFADRVILMRAGTVVADGSVAEIRAHASGRRIRAVVADAQEFDWSMVPGVTTFQTRGDAIELSCHDSDSVLRMLVARFPDAHDIEISAAGLEEAFLTLTANDKEAVA